MNPGAAEQNEQNNEQKAQQEAAKTEVDRLIAQIEQQMAVDIAEISRESNPDRKAELEKSFREKYLQNLNQQIAAREASEMADKPDKQEDFKEKAKEVKKSLLEADEVIKKTGSLTGKENVDKIFSGLVDKIRSGELSDKEIVDIEKTIGKQLADGVVLSTEGQQASSFEKNLKDLSEINQQAAKKVWDDLEEYASVLGKSKEDIKVKRGEISPTILDQPSQEEQYKKAREQMEYENSAWRQDEVSLYERRFTKDQRDFIEVLYSPDKFADYVDNVLNGANDKRRDEIAKEKARIRERVERHYRKRDISLSADQLDVDVEKIWREEASEQISGKLMEIANHLYLKLQQERPDKFFEEITQEDFMRGIKTTQIAMASAIDNLQITLSKIEQDPNNKLYGKIIKNHLSRDTEADYYIDERDGKRYPRLKPLPFGKEIRLSEFAQFMNISLNHWTHGMEYFHNTRVMFNHPPGEKGFYSQLGGYAEHLKGTDIDELLLLPDGQVIMQAYHLYDKMIEEEFASQDWKHRTNQFSNQLEAINTQLERQVLDRLILLYPDKSPQQLINAVNTAVGMARGMLLTEPEKSAFGDPVDPDGGGLYASYGTNDAGALTVFNPLHVNIRWQGEHLLPLFFYMPLSNEGVGMKGMWNHKQLWKYAEMYKDSLQKGVRSKDLPEKLFMDQIVDILNVGGPAKRKGWRMLYSLESHYNYLTYTEDGKEKKHIDPLKTFKAMEMIGYEGLFNFIDQKRAGEDVLNALPGSEKANWRDDFFRYIYQRYFFQGKQENFQEGDYLRFMAELKKTGKEKAMHIVKTTQAYPTGSLETEIEAQTSQLFLERFLTREIAARFPSKFLRMDRNRFHHDGVSRWQLAREILKEKGINWTADEFNSVMKDMTFAEMLLRQEMSRIVRDRIKINPKIGLHEFDDIPYRLDEEKIRSLLTQKVGHDGEPIIKDPARVNKVIELYRVINTILYGRGYLDDPDGAIKDVRDYTFTFGLEDTDISLMAWRGTGPRMTARALGDTGSMETNVIPWIIEMPRLLNKIAVSGKHDISPIIEYLQKAQDTITKVHGTGDDFKFAYKIASMVIQYFKKDSMAKPLFGLLRVGKRNSIAAEYAGRSTAVWEWDARDIDNFIVALESYNLLPKEPYDKTYGPKYEDRYLNILGRPVKFGKKIKVDQFHVWNSKKLRKEFGGTLKDMALEVFWNLGPAVFVFLVWKYLQEALEEAQGKKK